MLYREQAAQTYAVIKKYANQNGMMQAFSGITGMGVNLAVDALAIVWYRDMWNDIRAVYGKGRITKEMVFAFLKQNIGYIAEDIILDKGAGTIPVLGVPFNYRYAKALTWRLGVLFGLSAAAPDDVSHETMLRLIEAIRLLFPARGVNIGRYLGELLSFTFPEPDRERFIGLLQKAPECTDDQLRSKAEEMIRVWRT